MPRHLTPPGTGRNRKPRTRSGPLQVFLSSRVGKRVTSTYVRFQDAPAPRRHPVTAHATKSRTRKGHKRTPGTPRADPPTGPCRETRATQGPEVLRRVYGRVRSGTCRTDVTVCVSFNSLHHCRTPLEREQGGTHSLEEFLGARVPGALCLRIPTVPGAIEPPPVPPVARHGFP